MAQRRIRFDDADRTPSAADESEQFRVVDRRHFTDPVGVPVEPAESIEDKPRYPSYVEELLARCEEAERRFQQRRREMDEETARVRGRLEADFRRRLELERRDLLSPFLEVLDNLERTIASAGTTRNIENLLAGVEMTASLFRARLKSAGVEPVAVLDRPFDPNSSQAVGLVEVPDPERDGVVVEEVVRGYRMGDQLLRPAQVRVGKLAGTG